MGTAASATHHMAALRTTAAAKNSADATVTKGGHSAAACTGGERVGGGRGVWSKPQAVGLLGLGGMETVHPPHNPSLKGKGMGSGVCSLRVHSPDACTLRLPLLRCWCAASSRERTRVRARVRTRMCAHRHTQTKTHTPTHMEATHQDVHQNAQTTQRVN